MNKDFLKKCRLIKKKIWDRNDIKSMALYSIDNICIAVENGMDMKDAIDLIYRFSHCSAEHLVMIHTMIGENNLKNILGKIVDRKIREVMG